MVNDCRVCAKEVELYDREGNIKKNSDHSQGLVAGAAWELWRGLKPTVLEGKGKRAGKMPALHATRKKRRQKQITKVVAETAAAVV